MEGYARKEAPRERGKVMNGRRVEKTEESNNGRDKRRPEGKRRQTNKRGRGGGLLKEFSYLSLF